MVLGRRVGAAALTVALAAVACSACASSGAPGEVTATRYGACPDAQPAAAADRWWSTGSPVGGTTVTAVVVCTPSTTDGSWTGMRERTYTHAIAPLVDALRLPDLAATSAGTFCTTSLPLLDPVVVVDAAGRRALPRLPLDACGVPRAEVLAALTALESTAPDRDTTYPITG